MHIKQVLISGFRSFRSQNEIESFSPKHNVIVGRNGSGKSNFFDAIQFVLLAPKFATLRQEDRQNLLHEGAGSSVMAAYVEIVFDNSDGRFSVESDEVVLRRTVGQKKDEFFLNRKRIQKSEVASLLESAGFSKSNPYYIVQQGKVANLCVMKDKDRLNLLKEVAGTTVYEERRSESIKIMEDTASKQGKVEEVLAFIEERLSELEKEKKELSEYEQHDKMRRAVEYTIYDRDFIQANEQLVGLESDREGLRDEQQTLFADLRDVQDEIVQEDELLNNAKTSMDRLISRRDALATDMQQYANRKSSLEIDIQDLESSRQAKERNHDDWRKQLVTINQSIATCQQELSVLQPQIDQQEQQLQTLTTSLTNIDKRRTQLIVKQGRGKQFHSKKERDNFLTEQIGIMEGQYTKKQSIKKQRQAELTRQQQALQNEQQALIKDEQSNQTRLQSYDQLSTRIHDDIAVRNTLQEQRKTLWRETEKLQEQITEAKQDLERGKQQLNRTLPRTITQGLAAMELFVRQHNIRGYYGPLIDNFSLKADAFRNAVEVAAGNALFHIIVENDDIAAKLIKELERQNAGRLTFLPLSRLRVQPQRGFPDSTDVRPLIDVAIEYEAFLNPAMQLVFGGKLLARDIQTAAHFSKECHMDAITMEGDVVNHRGAFEGGYHDDRLSKIAAVIRIREATDKVNQLMEAEVQLKQQATQAEGKLNDLLRHVTKLEAEREALKALYEQQTRELKSRHKSLQNMSSTVEIERTTLSSLDKELTTIEEQIKSYQEEVKTPLKQTLTDEEREELREGEVALRHMTTEVERLKTAITMSTTIRDQLQQTLQDSYVKSKEELELKIALHTENDDPLSRDYESELIDLRLELQHCQQSLESMTKDVQEADHVMSLKAQESRSTEESLESKREIEKQLQERLNVVNKQLDRLFTKRSMLLETIQSRQKQIRDLGTLPRKELEACSQFNDNQLMSTLKSINEELKQYASVNRKALDQYMSFQEQRETLLERKQEMDRDTSAIETLIQNLDSQKDEAILRTFRGVSHHFTEVFSELVPGGLGKLVMRTSMDHDDEEDVEEIEENNILEESEGEEEEGGKRRGSRSSRGRASSSSTGKKGKAAKHPEISTFVGIQVSVQFSGRGQQYQMQQLSGGQKALVALALIFAIQRCDPAPFYLFDEIDQALDANYRTAVANLIQRQASSETAPAQFITTTFRPELVSVADKCFGIALMNKVSNIHPLEKADAQDFVTNLMKEDEAVGKVSSVPSFARARASPAATSRPSLELTSSTGRDEMKRKGRARQLQRRAEEIEQEGGGDEDEDEPEDQLEIDEDDELALRRLGLNDMEDDDEEDHMDI